MKGLYFIIGIIVILLIVFLIIKGVSVTHNIDVSGQERNQGINWSGVLAGIGQTLGGFFNGE